MQVAPTAALQPSVSRPPTARSTSFPVAMPLDALDARGFAIQGQNLERGLAPRPARAAQRRADALWYAGHVLTLGSLLSRINFPAAISVASVGQALTIASRPLGRVSANGSPQPLSTAQQVADAMWYVGHVMSLGSLLSHYSLIAAVCVATTGQACTIASRPVGRLGTSERSTQAQAWADALWYLGHVLSLGSLLSRYNLPAAACLAGVGQGCTMISRPIGRIAQRTRGGSDDTV